MPAVSINVRMDQDLKKAFEEFCNDVGLSMSAAFTLFAKRTLLENRLPFNVGRDVPNAETVEAFAEAERMRNDPSLGKSYSSAEEMIKDILEND